MPIWGWVCVGLVAAVVLLIVFALIKGAWDRRRYEREAEEFIGWIVRADPDLYTRGGQVGFMQVLVGFDGDPMTPDFALAQLAKDIAKLKDLEPATDDGAAVAVEVRDGHYRPYHWFQLPTSLTGGREVYLLHLEFARQLVPDKVLKLPFVRCLLFRNQPDTQVFMARYQPSDEMIQVPELSDDSPLDAGSTLPGLASSRPALKAAAYALRAQNVPSEEARQLLIEAEYPAGQVDSIIKEVWRKQTSEPGQGQGCGQVVIGGVLLVVGLGITIYTFQKAEGGGTYFVMTGFIVSGIWNIIRGLARMAS